VDARLMLEMRNGYPFIVHSGEESTHNHGKNNTLKPRQAAILCTQEKVGSTMWRMAFSAHHQNVKSSEIDPLDPGQRVCMTEQHVNMLKMNANVTRMMLVRNPYARFLSAYLDKIVKDFEIWKHRYFRWIQPDMKRICERVPPTL